MNKMEGANNSLANEDVEEVAPLTNGKKEKAVPLANGNAEEV
jgi:hypothetical protein